MNACAAVVMYCHAMISVQARFLYRAQDLNMTNGDFAFFTFDALRSILTDKLWMSFNFDLGHIDDLPRRQRAFYAVKQVFLL